MHSYVEMPGEWAQLHKDCAIEVSEQYNQVKEYVISCEPMRVLTVGDEWEQMWVPNVSDQYNHCPLVGAD